MKNILKQFVVSGMNLKNNNFKRAVLKLTAYYSIGIFIVLLVFSSAFYFIFSEEIDSNIEEFEVRSEEGFFEDWLEESPLHEIQENMLSIIIWLDLATLVLIITGSYFLSKKTLKPLEESFLKQKSFIANASHEFKTPLTIIKAGSETLLSRDRDVKDYKAFIADLLEETDRLSNLSNDLLYLSQNDFIKDASPINSSEIINKYISNIKPYADSKRISVKSEIEDNVNIHVNKGDFVRLLINILKNAVDYNQEGGEVFVSLNKKQRVAVIAIKDNGIGIAEEKLNLIFEPFYKIDDSRSKHTGHGLGLSIVREIVNKYSGEISVNSILGEGTTVTISFPCL